MVMLLGAVANLIMFVAAIQVEGTTSCPTSDRVAARLADMLPAERTDGEQRDRVRLREVDNDLLVVLEHFDGTVLATRRFPRTFQCEDLAAAAAVSVAAWQSDVHPEFSSRLTARASPPNAPRELGVSPGASPPQHGRMLTLGVSFGLGGSVDVPRAAGDVVLGGWLTFPSASTVLRADLEAQSVRQIPLESGHASWRRWIFGVGLERPFFVASEGSGGGAREAHWFVLARLARLDLSGEGFALNHDDHAFDPGAAAGLRAVFPSGRWLSSVELAVSVWPVRHDALAGGTSDIGRLPTIEAFVRIGAARGFGR